MGNWLIIEKCKEVFFFGKFIKDDMLESIFRYEIWKIEWDIYCRMWESIRSLGLLFYVWGRCICLIYVLKFFLINLKVKMCLNYYIWIDFFMM